MMRPGAGRSAVATLVGALAILLGIVAAHIVSGVAWALVVAGGLTVAYFVMRWLQWEHEQAVAESEAIEAMRRYVRLRDMDSR